MQHNKSPSMTERYCQYNGDGSNNGGGKNWRTVDAQVLFGNVVGKARKNLRDFACEMSDKGCPYRGDDTMLRNDARISAFIVNNGGLKLHLRCLAACPNKDFANMCTSEPYQTVPNDLARSTIKEMKSIGPGARKPSKK